MECDATERVATGKVAEPPLIVPVPRVVAPSLNVTVPVAVLGDTAAVSTTLCVNADGLAEDVRPVVVTA